MISEATIVARGVPFVQYRAEAMRQSEKNFALTERDLVEFADCPARWAGRRGTQETDPAGAGYVFDAMTLGVAAAKRLYAPRPATYRTRVLECPACKSQGKGAVCSRCGQHRRKVDVERPWAGAAEECKGWAAAQEMAGRTVVPAAMWDRCAGAAEALARDSLCRGALEKAERNLVLRGVWQAEAGGPKVAVMAHIGVVPADHSAHYRCLASIRAVTATDIPTWVARATGAGLFLEAALQLALFEAATEDGRNGYLCMAVEHDPPHVVGRRQLSAESLRDGRAALERLLAAYALCDKHRVWPGFDTDEKGQAAWTVVDAPAWWLAPNVARPEGQSAASVPPGKTPEVPRE